MKLGIIGAGGIGSVHARHASRLPGIELAICDSETSKAATLAGNVGAQMIESSSDLINKVDAVVICIPTDYHAEVTCQALAAGRHVLVEKPMAISLVACDEMIAANKGSVLAVGQVARFFPEHRKMASLVREGKIGSPGHVRMRRVGGLPKNYHGWFSDEERSGGVLLDFAVHDFDWLNWVVGPVEEVFSRSVKASRPEVEGDFALTTLKFKNGCVGHVESSWMDKAFRTTVEISGAKGCMEFDTRSSATVRIETGGPVQAFSPQATFEDPYSLQLRAFLARVEGKESLVATGEEGRDAVRIALAAVESTKSGQAVRL